jgi:hypothetical protein
MNLGTLEMFDDASTILDHMIEWWSDPNIQPGLPGHVISYDVDL